jgi:hypothetical protein
MQLNGATSNANVKQWICGCNGIVKYKNEHRWSPPLELKGKRS